MKKEQVLTAIREAEKDPSKLLELIKKHGNKSDPFNFEEFFQSLPKRLYSQLWDGVRSLTQQSAEKAIEKLEACEDTDEHGDEAELDKTTVSLLSCVVTLCQSALSKDAPHAPSELVVTLQILHDILVSLLGSAPVLQNHVSQLCEGWWSAGGEGRDNIMPNTLLYLVARTLTEGATHADVKRVWLVREAFILLDFEDPTTEPFKSMLLSCMLQHVYLHTDEGRKFLSFLFGMHPRFVEDLHQTIKNQIPHSPKTLLEIYGEIYYRAWRLASGPYLKQIEEHCLQDLMYSAVNGPRHGVHSLFHSLRKLLGYIHQQRSQKSVSEMLYRLYNPFLWRSLKVANMYVRANAATLFLDGFPLQDPNWTREEMDAVMQKQFDAMTELLDDPSVMVRVVTVAGVCRVLSYYWEMIPAPVIKTLLGRLVKDLAWDASAINVRVAVLQGLSIILENRLSHPVLRELLPLLQNHLHDTSEKVRIAFLELLLLVKGMRMVKFWHIAPLEHLLARMEVDTVHVVKRIVALLIDSFQPDNVSQSQQIERCITLLRANPGASRRFYQLAVTHLSAGDVVKFILSIHTAVMQCVRGEGVEGESGKQKSGGGVEEEEEDMESSEGDSDKGDEIEDERTGIAEGGWRKEKADAKTQLNKDMEDESDCSPLTLEDSELMTGLLETIVVLWEGVRESIDKSGNKQLKKKLITTISGSLPLLFDTFKDGPSRSALYLLASYLPKKNVSSISKGTLVALSSLSYPVKSQDYTSLLVALVAWQQAADVVKLTNQWLALELGRQEVGGELTENYMERDENCKRNATHPKKKTKRSKTAAMNPINGLHPGHTHHALLALDILNWMTSHPSCLEELKKLKEFWDLATLLKKSMVLLEQYFFSASPAVHGSHTPISFELLGKSLSLYIRLCMHKQNSRETEQQRNRGKSNDTRRKKVPKKASNQEPEDASEDDREESEEDGQEFVAEIREVLDWCGRVVVPALNENFTKGHARAKTRQSNRKRKAGQAHPPPEPPAPPTTNQAREITGMVLNLLSEMLMTGLSSGGLLELSFARLGALIANTSSGSSMLSYLCKLLYQLCESSGKSEVDGIHSGSASLKPTGLLLKKILDLTRSMSEAGPDGFSKVWYQVRQCISAIVVTSVRTHSLSLSSHLLDTYTAIVDSLVQAELDHIKTHPSLDPPTALDDLPLFSGCLMKQACKDSQSKRLFAVHLGAHLVNCDPNDLPGVLLTHQASLHLISVMTSTSGRHGDDEMMRCIRQSIRLVGEITDEQKTRWNAAVSELNSLIDVVQEKILT